MPPQIGAGASGRGQPFAEVLPQAPASSVRLELVGQELTNSLRSLTPAGSTETLPS